MDSRRIFVGIDISDAARAVCSSHIESLRKEFSHVRVGWERREKLHITLKFLGPTSEEDLAALTHHLVTAVEQRPRFGLKLQDPGSFPERAKPRILWIGVGGATNELVRLQSELEKICESLGYKRETKPFHPHITIGRIRDHRDANALAEAHRSMQIERVEFEVEGIAVYESKLQPKGSVYTKLLTALLARD